MVVIWNGEEFVQVSEAQAEAMAKADKAQILDGTVDGLALKTRKQFTGYKTREIRAEPQKKVNYSSLTVAKLKKMMDKRGLDYTGMLKADLVAALEADDEMAG